MKSLKRKVLLSAIVLMFALVATVGSTYAWFTVSNTVNVEALTLNVTSEDSLLIKVAAEDADWDLNYLSNMDASAYKTTITSSDVTTVYTLLSTYMLAPVTIVQLDYASVDVDNFYFLSNISDGARPVTALTDEINSSAGKIIQINFWVMSQSNSNVTLYMSNFDISSTITALEDASRATYIVSGDLDGGLDSAASYTTPVMYANSGAFDLDYAFVNGLPGYVSSPWTDTNFNMLDQHTADLSTTLETATTVGAVSTDKASATAIATLYQNEPMLLTMYVFLEGWDADCTNEIIAASMNISFSLKISA